MPRQIVQLSGMSATGAYKDGEMSTLVNMRKTGGVLRPVVPFGRMAKYYARTYDKVIFVPAWSTETENPIDSDTRAFVGLIYRQDGGTDIYFDGETNPFVIADRINDLRVEGIVMAFVGAATVYYGKITNLWQGVSGGSALSLQFTYLGSLPELPVISFSHAGWASEINISKGTDNEVGVNTDHDNDDLLWNKLEELYNGLINKYVSDNNALPLNDAHFIRYAIRLYDNSLIKLSAPILVMPSSNISKIDAPENIFESLDVDIRTWIETNNVSKAGAVFYDVGNDKYIAYAAMLFYTLKLQYDFTVLQSWNDIVKSVDVFMSTPLNVSGRNTVRSDVNYYWLRINSKNSGKVFCPTQTLTASAKDNVENNGEMFLVKSISDFTSTNITFPSTDVLIKSYDVLATKEILKDEAVVHSYGAGDTYLYNKRLHLFKLQQSFFAGFAYDMFAWGATDGSGNPSKYNGQSYSATDSISPSASQGYIYIVVHLKSVRTYETVIHKVSVAQYQKMFSSAFISYPDGNAYKMEIGFMDLNTSVPVKIAEFQLKRHSTLDIAYYYDPNLKPIGKQQYTGTLSADKNKSIELKDTMMVSGLDNYFLYKSANMYTFEGNIRNVKANKLSVTDRNYGQYPLYIFTDNGPWMLQVGDGEVVYSNIISPTVHVMPVSDLVENTPYGIAFIGKRGVYVLNGQQPIFLSEQLEYPSKINLEANSKLDAMFINLSGVSFTDYCQAADGMAYNHLTNELMINKTGTGYMFVYNFDSKMWYVSTEKIDGFVQNDTNNGYCFENFDTPIYPDGTQTGETTVKQYIKSFNLKKIETVILTTGTPVVTYRYKTPATISMITRPLLFGSQNEKLFSRLIIRGLFYGWRALQTGNREIKGCFAIYDSIDGINFRLIQGQVRSTSLHPAVLPPADYVNDPQYAGATWKTFTGEAYKPINLKDIDSGLMAGMKTRYVILALAAVVNEDTQIQYIDAEVKGTFDNEKME